MLELLKVAPPPPLLQKKSSSNRGNLLEKQINLLLKKPICDLTKEVDLDIIVKIMKLRRSKTELEVKAL
jgi:hypothetical protein